MSWLKKSLNSLASTVSVRPSNSDLSDPKLKTPASPDDVNPVEWLESSDFSWTCANNGGGESLSFFIHLKDQQGFVFFQIAFSSAGLSPLVIVSFHYTNSTKHSMISESQTFSGSDLKLNGDKSGMVIASKSSTVSLNMTKSDDGMIRYEVELALNKGLKAKFAFTAKEKPCKVGTGLFTYGKVGTTGYKLLPFGTVTGSASNSKDTLAFEGYAMVSKNEMTARADQLGVSWETINFHHSPTQTMFWLIEMTGLDRSMGYYGVLVKQGRLIGVGVEGTRQVHQSHKDDATKYELCDECTFSFTGKRSTDETLQPFSVTVHSNGSKLWRRTDMLGELPLLIRKIIQSFMSKPFAFMWWEKAKAEITVGDEKEELESFAYRESTILNDK